METDLCKLIAALAKTSKSFLDALGKALVLKTKKA